ncbi:MAG: adenylate/guanylate cyclase domain-containing protein, partial [Gammaproteobacteria bacterium]|nr:adenylate/guanylate cyclase domain-containing protein [Gammaproteobacteria bacterium]
QVLRELHEALGQEIDRFGGTIGFFAGDGLMVFFNDPVPCPDPALRAVRMAVAMRSAVQRLAIDWAQRDVQLGFGIGISLGYATMGRVGVANRSDYTAIGSVVNQAARLCAEAAPGQILVSRRVHRLVESTVESAYVADFTLKGFARPVPGFNILAFREAVTEAPM